MIDNTCETTLSLVFALASHDSCNTSSGPLTDFPKGENPVEDWEPPGK